MRYMDKYLGELLNLHLDSFCLNWTSDLDLAPII